MHGASARVFRCANPVLRVQTWRLGNGLAGALLGAPAESALLACGAALLTACAASSSYDMVKHLAVFSVTRPVTFAAGSLALSALIGAVAGHVLAGKAEACAREPWLAALPWSLQARMRAARQASAAGALAPGCGFIAAAWAVERATHGASPLSGTACAATAFAAGYAGATLIRLGPWTSTPTTEPAAPIRPSGSLIVPLLRRIDQPTPRHAGRWSFSGRMGRIALIWLATLAVFGAVAAALRFSQGRVLASLLAAVLGANANFIFALRCFPLAASALRSTSARYAAATMGVVRVPLVLSLVCFVPMAGLAAGADPAAWRIVPGCAVMLLVLNALYTAAACIVPGSPRQAFFLYAGGVYLALYQGASYGPSYGILTFAAVWCVALLLWRRARARYRAFHG